MDIKRNYEESKTKNNFPIIQITQKEFERAHEFVKAVCAEKRKEMQYIVDGNRLQKRYETGILGEIAVYKLLGYTIDDVDLSIGRANQYFHADLKNIGFYAGVKTVEAGKAPVVFKKSYYGEIICVIENPLEVTICGYATPKILSKYSSDELILDKKLRERGTKTGFYGFQYLIPIHNQLDFLVAVQ